MHKLPSSPSSRHKEQGKKRIILVQDIDSAGYDEGSWQGRLRFMKPLCVSSFYGLMKGFLSYRDLDAALPTVKPKIMTFGDPPKESVHSGFLRYAELGVATRQWWRNKGRSRGNLSKANTQTGKHSLIANKGR